MNMSDILREEERWRLIAERTISNLATQGRHYPEGTTEMMVKAALEMRCNTDPLANARKGLDAMERVLSENERA